MEWLKRNSVPLLGGPANGMKHPGRKANEFAVWMYPLLLTVPIFSTPIAAGINGCAQMATYRLVDCGGWWAYVPERFA
jgi:hypothetical protein